MASNIIAVKCTLKGVVMAYQTVVVNTDLAQSLIRYWSSRAFKLSDKGTIVTNMDFPADLPPGEIFEWGIDLSEVVAMHTMPAEPVLLEQRQMMMQCQQQLQQGANPMGSLYSTRNRSGF